MRAPVFDAHLTPIRADVAFERSSVFAGRGGRLFLQSRAFSTRRVQGRISALWAVRGLSRRRSRVRVPSLPLSKCLQTTRFRAESPRTSSRRVARQSSARRPRLAWNGTSADRSPGQRTRAPNRGRRDRAFGSSDASVTRGSGHRDPARERNGNRFTGVVTSRNASSHSSSLQQDSCLWGQQQHQQTVAIMTTPGYGD